MKIKLVLGLMLVTAVIFSLQNAIVVDGKFLTWKLTMSLKLVFIVTWAAGLINSGAGSGALWLHYNREKK